MSTTTKTHTLIIRGVAKSDKNKLKRIARERKDSVNKVMLHAIEYYLGNQISTSKEIQP